MVNLKTITRSAICSGTYQLRPIILNKRKHDLICNMQWYVPIKTLFWMNVNNVAMMICNMQWYVPIKTLVPTSGTYFICDLQYAVVRTN